MKALTVIHPFGAYARGAIIANAATVAEIEAGPNAHHCVAVTLPDATGTLFGGSTTATTATTSTASAS
jgi:hypothetical protein